MSPRIVDRSHPEIVRLDGLRLTYPGWEDDFETAERRHLDQDPSAGLLDYEDAIHTLQEKQRVHEGSRSHPRLVALDALSLTYPQSVQDWQDAEEWHFRHACNRPYREGIFQNKMDDMNKRQRFFEGDRSHNDLVLLDALRPTLTYPGWERDFRIAEKRHLGQDTFACLNDFEDALHTLKEKQRVHDGDRSHPRLVVLDALQLSYPQHERDRQEAEEWHFKNATNKRFQEPNFQRRIDQMQKRQSELAGDRSHPELVRIDSLHLTYPGWECDFKTAENRHFGKDAMAGLNDFDDAVHTLEEKQRVHTGDRSHPRLVALDTLRLSYPKCDDDRKDAEEWHFRHAYNRPLHERIFQKKIAMMKRRQRSFVGELPAPTDAASADANTEAAETGDSVDIDSRPQKRSRMDGAEIDTGRCIVCLDKPRSVAFLPCGHVVSCDDCGAQTRRNNGQCPICRKDIEQVSRLYFS